MDVNTVLGVALGYIIAQALRWLARRRFWATVVTRAKGYLDDPAVPIQDPRKAVEAALVDEQSQRVRRVAQSIAPQNKER
jgi:hypothetical protein